MSPETLKQAFEHAREESELITGSKEEEEEDEFVMHGLS